MDLSWMAWTLPDGDPSFSLILMLLVGMGVWEYFVPGGSPRVGILRFETYARRPSVRLAAGFGVHQSRLARTCRSEPVVGSGSVCGLRHRVFRYV